MVANLTRHTERGRPIRINPDSMVVRRPTHYVQTVRKTSHAHRFHPGAIVKYILRLTIAVKRKLALVANRKTPGPRPLLHDRTGITRVPRITDPVQYDVAHGPLAQRAFPTGLEVDGQGYTHKLFHGTEVTTKRLFVYIGIELKKIKFKKNSRNRRNRVTEGLEAT